jgi:hypothetical protein
VPAITVAHGHNVTTMIATACLPAAVDTLNMPVLLLLQAAYSDRANPFY